MSDLIIVQGVEVVYLHVGMWSVDSTLFWDGTVILTTASIIHRCSALYLLALGRGQSPSQSAKNDQIMGLVIGIWKSYWTSDLFLFIDQSLKFQDV